MLSSVLLAISSDLDNFGVGFAHGAARRMHRPAVAAGWASAGLIFIAVGIYELFA